MGFKPTNFGESFDNIAKGAGNTVNAIGEAVNDVSKNVAEVAGNVAESVTEFAGKATEKITEGAENAIEGATKITDKAGEVATDFATSAQNVAQDVVQGAVNVASGATGAVVETVSTAGAVVAGAVSGAKDVIDTKAAEKLEFEKAEYAPELEGALDSLKGTRAEELLAGFGESPLPLTYGNVARVKSIFPIPREQIIIWMDAEFDLRPSGIAFTDKGVYIKSDVEAFAFPGKEKKLSQLFYFEWEYFDPASFTVVDKDNLALTVSEECRWPFLDGCNNLTAKSNESNLEYLAYELSTKEFLENVGATNVMAVNTLEGNQKVFVEQRAAIRNSGGHGELAEEANNIVDKIQGHKAEILGRNNAKNGADRMVDGVQIQTKYYKAARGSLEACFDPKTHQYRYLTDEGKPMQLEVPRDQYEQVLHGFKKKIEQGKVPGVNDPEEAKNIIRKGKLTYQQAVNLAKPGTLESVAYDAATGVVSCSCAFGFSFVATSFMTYRETKDINSAVQAGIVAGIQVFGLAFLQHMIVSQLSRTSLANTLLTPSQAVVGKLGTKASATIINGLRALSGKAAVSGATASKQLTKMLRSNAITVAVTLVVFSVSETYKLIQGKSSGAQYIQNIISIVTSTAGSVAGVVAAGVAAGKVAGVAGTAVAPGVGTVVGLAGGMAGGMAVAFATNAIGDIFYEGDSVSFGRYFNAMVSCMAIEYLLDGDEVDKLLDELNNVKTEEFKRLIEETFPAENQEEVLRNFLTPKFEAIVSQREHFACPSDEQLTKALTEFETEFESEESAE